MTRIALLAIGVSAVALPALAEGKLNLYNWGDYTSPDLIKKFEDQTGIDVTITDYDSNDTALAKRKSTHGACYLHNAIDIHKPSANLTHRWLINGNWKLILPHKTNTNATEPELYNLTKDPHEHQNLAKTKPGQAKRLAKRLNKLLPES